MAFISRTKPRAAHAEVYGASIRRGMLWTALSLSAMGHSAISFCLAEHLLGWRKLFGPLSESPFGEAACLLGRHCEHGKAWMTRYEKKHGKAKALATLAPKLGRTVYHLWHKRVVFDETRLFAS
jgi:hypothetical protein